MMMSSQLNNLGVVWGKALGKELGVKEGLGEFLYAAVGHITSSSTEESTRLDCRYN